VTAHARNRRFFVTWLRPPSIRPPPSCQWPLESSNILPFFFRVFLSPLRCGSFLCSPAFPCDCKWVAFCLASHMLTRFDPFQHPPTIPHSRCIPPLSLSSGASSGDPCPHVHVQSATSAIHMKVKKTRYYHAYAASSRSPSPPTTHKRAGCVVHHQTKGSITRAPLTPVILPTPISI
jgi:hypothetical protein